MLLVCALCLVDSSSGSVVIFRSVILVADGEHEVREERQFEESEVPVALVLLSMQILCLSTECQLVVDAILSLCDVDVRMDQSAVSLNHRLVIELVHIHEVELERLRQLLLNLYVEVLIVCLVAPLPESRAVSVCTRSAAVLLVLLDGVNVREVELEACAVLAAERCVALELISELCLISPFAVELCGVGIEGSESVCLLEGECGKVVDESRRTVLRASAAEAHVVRAFSLEQEAHAAARVRCGEHCHVSLTVDEWEVLVERGVFCLLCVFSEDTEVASLKVGSHVKGVGVLRQTQLVRRVCHDVVVSLLMLVHPRSAEGKECALLLHLLEPLVNAYFEVST